MTTETDIQAAIVQALRSLGFWVIRLQVIGRRGGPSNPGKTGEPGLPDLYLPGLGHLEVKHPQNTRGLSPDQVKWRDKARAHGVNVATVRSAQEAVDVVQKWKGSVRLRESDGGAHDHADGQGAAGEALQPLLDRLPENGEGRVSVTDIRAAFRAAGEKLSKKGKAK